MRRYAVVRTDRNVASFVLSELEQGRFRQGWGYRASQDLRAIRKKLEAGQPLDQDERASWRNRRLLDSEPDGLKAGDIIITPNLPEQGRWLILRVGEGGYRFEPGAHRVEYGDGYDYAHVVPVTPIRDRSDKIAVVEADNEHVDARLRSTMKSRSRMWSIDWLSREVDALVQAIEAGRDTTRVQPDADKMKALAEAVHASAWKQIESRYQAAELERLVERLMARIYRNGAQDGTVERWGGPKEDGADLIVFTQDPLEIEYKVGVQVKRYEGVHDDLGALEQMKRARQVHRIDGGVIVTTASDTSERFEKRRQELQAELGIDIRIITRREFVELVLRHIGLDA
jgi:hypothetical protein